MTPSRLLAECADARELQELLAFVEIEHLGVTDNDRADLRAGIIASTIVRTVGGLTGHPPEIDASDFLPRFEDPDAPESATAMDPQMFSMMMHARFPGAG